MYRKILHLSLLVLVFSSCTTVYKSGQTPDDVYYSPMPPVPEVKSTQNNNTNQYSTAAEIQEDDQIRMAIRYPRLREFNEDYSYSNSPYYYCTCNCNIYGYYYNPPYYHAPVYAPFISYNKTPRMANLRAYSGVNSPLAPVTKTGMDQHWATPQPQYNNSNGVTKVTRQTIKPGKQSSSSSNDTRTYTPSSSSSNNNSNSSSTSGSSNSSGTVTRPNRGG